ncbi:nuclear pore complex protein Nup133 [Engraulis encrasicolus]|uniref:nuclear pore complex protein Nup133 n=1 Tax=Engraulis encrasicolus TaxID=184585 RepID=UPI002FD3A279
MFSPRGTPGSGRRQARTGGRKSLSTPAGLLFSPRRASLQARSTPSRIPTHGPVEAVNFDVQTFGSSLPVKVMEALTMAEPDDQISVKIEETGWAWMVCGERLVIWKICQTAVAKLSVCKDLQLPASEFAYTADLISISSANPLDSAPIQSISVLAVSPEGTARFWPSLVHEGTYTETSVDFGENLCNFVGAVKGNSYIVSSYKGQMVRVAADASGKPQQRVLLQGQSMLSGIGRRVSSLFGRLAPPTDITVHSVLWVAETGSLYTLTSGGLNKWEVDEAGEQQVLSWSGINSLAEGVSDAIWGSEANYDEIKAGVNVAYLDMQLSQEGVVVLAAAWHPADTPCLVYYCLVTVPDRNPLTGDEISVEVTKHNPAFQSEEEMHTTHLVIPRACRGAAYLYNQELVFTCSMTRGRGALPEERIAFTDPGDRLRGGGVCANLPVFFTQNSGLVAVVPRESASMLPEMMEDSLCSSVAGPGTEPAAMEVPKMDEVAQEDKIKLLKSAFLQFCRHDLVGAQAVVDELFPSELDGGEGAELDEVVAQISCDLVDDFPASDPRWAESVPDERAGFPLTSLILLHQLEDKMKAHGCLIDFLNQMGLLERLSSTDVRGSPMATRLLLCEHAEKLTSAMVLKNHHAKHPDVVTPAIASALRRSASEVPPSLTAADVFFREVSGISSILECLLEEEERALQENPVNSTKWGQIVIHTNNIIKDMLQAACQYRESKSSVYRASETAGAEPEYIPWTASSSVRSVLTRQHEVILKTVYPQADSELRNTLSEQLVALLNSYLSGYQAQLGSLNRATQTDRCSALEMEYTQRRSELLMPLLELGQYQWVSALAEKYGDFDILVQMCEKTDNQSRLQHYMTKFADQNFADFLFRWYMEKGKRGKLLSQPIAQHQQLASFLQAHDHLSWLHDIHVHDYASAHQTLHSQANMETRYFVKKKTLLALSKLTALASDMPEDAMQKQVDDIVEQERFLLHQETLPKQLLEEKQLNMDTMPLLSAHNLINLYICDDNRRANEYDFKKALDLLDYIDEEDAVDLEALKCEILCKALKRDNWSSADGNDNPVEAAKDSIFIRIIEKLIQDGVSLQTYLPDVKDLLQLEEMEGLRAKPTFEFVLRANYEHYLQVQM